MKLIPKSGLQKGYKPGILTLVLVLIGLKAVKT